jgi:phage terminase small subunit
MSSSIYQQYLIAGTNTFYLRLVKDGQRNSWLLKQITEELEESSAQEPAKPTAKAIKVATAESTEQPSANTLTKINYHSLPAGLQKLYDEAKEIYRSTAAIHNELAVDVYQQANLIPQAKRGEMISQVIEGRTKANKIYARIRVFEETGIDPGDDEKPPLDETNPLPVLKKIQSLRSSNSRWKKINNKEKLAEGEAELERLESIYKSLTNA